MDLFFFCEKLSIISYLRAGERTHVSYYSLALFMPGSTRRTQFDKSKNHPGYTVRWLHMPGLNQLWFDYVGVKTWCRLEYL